MYNILQTSKKTLILKSSLLFPCRLPPEPALSFPQCHAVSQSNGPWIISQYNKVPRAVSQERCEEGGGGQNPLS